MDLNDIVVFTRVAETKSFTVWVSTIAQSCVMQSATTRLVNTSAQAE